MRWIRSASWFQRPVVPVGADWQEIEADDAGTKVSEEGGGQRGAELACQIEDSDVIQDATHRDSSLRSIGCRGAVAPYSGRPGHHGQS
ncbi:MAG: hypothetical protein V9E93_15265 [Steroidobacteraceae bacterium]